MNFIVLPRGSRTPPSGLNTAYLTIDHWNDFSFVTMFYLELHDEQGALHDIGNVKIGFKGQTTEQSTHTLLGRSFQQLSDGYFSVGQDVDYYRKISSLIEPLRTNLLTALKDIVLSPKLICSGTLISVT